MSRIAVSGRTAIPTNENLFTYSEDFAQAAYTKTFVAATGNAALAPDGTTTANLLTDTVDLDSHTISITPSGNGIYMTISVYVKMGTLSEVTIGPSGFPQLRFDLSTGTLAGIGSSSIATLEGGDIEPVANGFYRIWVAYKTPVFYNLVTGSLFLTSGGSTVYSGGTGTLYAWGFQCARTNHLTPYIKTTGSASTSGPLRITASGRLTIPRQQNLILYSNTFDNVVWAANALTPTPSAAANPLTGAVNAYAIVEDGTLDIHVLSQNLLPAVAPGKQQSVSLFVKAANRSWIGVAPSNGTAITYFNISAGTVGIQSSSTGRIRSVGNGWYQVTVTCDKIASQDEVRIYVCSGNGVVSFTGNGLTAFYIYQAQLALANWTGDFASTTNSRIDTGGIRNLVSP